MNNTKHSWMVSDFLDINRVFERFPFSNWRSLCDYNILSFIWNNYLDKTSQFYQEVDTITSELEKKICYCRAKDHLNQRRKMCSFAKVSNFIKFVLRTLQGKINYITPYTTNVYYKITIWYKWFCELKIKFVDDLPKHHIFSVIRFDTGKEKYIVNT